MGAYGKNVAKMLGLTFGLHGTEEDLFINSVDLYEDIK